MTPVRKAPPLDPELVVALAPYGDGPMTLTAQMIPVVRGAIVSVPDTVVAGRDIVYTERTVPGPVGAADLTLAILERPDRKPGGPVIYYVHGGGLIIADRWFGLGPVLDWVTELDAVLISVEYRLAPEAPFPGAFDDCYAGLEWVAANTAELGVDGARLVVAGASAGGGLAAAVTLKARDVEGPRIAAQVLIYPMLDDRNETVSSHQYDGFGRWDRGSNDTGWTAYLGDRRGTADVPAYAAPARATDLSNLPPTFIDVGSAEVFRDEDVAYASQIWADGGICELHVWPGAFHACDMEAPTAQVSAAMIAARTDWLRRTVKGN